MEVYNNGSARYYSSGTLPLEKLAYWIAFSRVSGIGPVRFKLLLDFFHDDVKSAWYADRTALAAARLDQHTIEKFLRQRLKITPEQELERLQRLRIQIVTWCDPDYPPLLLKIEHAPPVLYLCGNLTGDDQRYTIGIVGTRKMSAYGRQVTEYFSRELVSGKTTIVSGLALGVDTVAHTTALDYGGRTLAVLASGLDQIYPKSNYELAKRIAESGQGALITAFPLGVRPDAGNFPARNHLIAGLSLGVLVTEAPERSGALLTANSALQQGREVFAVPGAIFSAGGGGVNKLIQEGAHPVTSVNDILFNLNLHLVPKPPIVQQIIQSIMPDNEEEQLLLSVLQSEPLHIDEIIRASHLDTHVVSSNLVTMELKGMVKHVGGMQYIRSIY